MTHKVSIGIILFKAEKYLPFTLKSLAEQDYENIEFLFRDQSPNFEAYEYIKNELPEYFEKFTIQKGSNRLHSGGHNDLINQMTGDYYICASNDMYYPKNFVSSVVKALEKEENKNFGTATVKLMRWDFDSITNEKLQMKNGLEKSFTNIIDSCGITLTKAHRFFDLGQTELDQGQYDHLQSIFGGSGALTIFRKNALDTITFVNKDGKKEYYDELLHYKNDVDLAYRLQWAGEKCLFLPHIQVWHDRQVKSVGGGIAGMFRSRKDKNVFAKESSYFGQQVMLLKNYSSDFSWNIRCKTFFFQLCSKLFLALFEPKILGQNKKIQENFSEIMEKKSRMYRVVSPDEIEKFMS